MRRFAINFGAHIFFIFVQIRCAPYSSIRASYKTEMMKWLWTPCGMEERKTKFLQSYINIDIVSHVRTRFFCT